MHELPLVFFTVFTQCAVGAFILLLIGGALKQIDARRMAVGLFTAMCLFGLGVVIGIFHVGQPARALNMLFRVGASPMSNEIALSAVFGMLGGLSALGLLLKRGASSLFVSLAWLAAAVGVIFVLAIPRIYQLPTVATWSSHYTTAIMVLTPFIGGGALAAFFGARRVGLWVCIIAILASFCLVPGYMSTITNADSALASAQTTWFTAQGVLLALGLICAMAYARRNSGQPVLATAVLVIVAAELAGRVAFYNLWTLPM